MLYAIRLLALIGLFFGYPVCAEGLNSVDSGNADPGLGHQVVAGETVNMIDYLLPKQTADDEKPFHLVGYCKCLWGECSANGESAYSESGFFKVYRTAGGGNGDIRYVAMKTPVKPAEYSVVKEIFERGRWITKSFLEDEDMRWDTGGWELRDYHDAAGFPTFEWGRSDAVSGQANVQVIPWCTWRYCGEKPDWREAYGTTSVYTVQEFVLTNDFSDIVEQLGDRVFDGEMAGILAKWLALSKELGRGKPKLMVLSGYWASVTPGVTSENPTLWYQREIYSYLEGVGWVGWWWQNHANNDQNAPFSTMKGVAMDRVVWEDPANPILAYDVCAQLPSGYASPVLFGK